MSRLFVLVSLSFTLLCSGCGLELFGSSQSLGTGDAGACTKDLDALEDLLVRPEACITSAQCPAGSFCNTGTGVCDWQCYADSDCGAGGTCSCQGLCQGSDAGAGTPLDPSCPREPSLLLDPATKARACVFDEDCPFGARCDDTTKTCTWDCLSTDDPTYGCTGGKVCDCFGRCVVVGPELPPEPANRLHLEVFPTWMPVVSPSPGAAWAPRQVDIALRAEDEVTATGAATATVQVTAGAGLEVTCNLAVPYGTSCAIAAWTFAPKDAVYRATASIWVRPTLPLERQSWTVAVTSDAAANAPQLVHIAPPRPDTPDDGIGSSPQPLDGEYAGIVTLVGASAGTGGASSPGALQIPVRAWVKESLGTVDLYDAMGILSPNGKLRVPKTGTLVWKWLIPSDEVPGDDADTTGYLGAQVTPVSQKHTAAAGTLTGSFRVRLSFSPTGTSGGDSYLHWEYSLRRVGSNAACASCPSETSCDATLGICTAGTAFTTSDPWVMNNLLNTRRSDWLARVSILAQNTAGTSTFAGLPQLYVTGDIYDATVGIASPSLDPHVQEVAANYLATNQGQGAGLNLCTDDFMAYLQWMDGQMVGGADVAPVIYDSGVTLSPADTSICTRFYNNVTQWKNNYVPCVNPTPLSTPAPTGKLAALPSTRSASCAAVHQNYSRTTSITYSSFLSTKCVAITEQLRINASDYHQLYLCSYKEALLGPLTPTALAERDLCFDADTTTTFPVESRRFGTSTADVLGVSGDLACAGGLVPHGADLVTHADRVAVGDADPLGSGPMVRQCLEDLWVEPPPLPAGWNETTVREGWAEAFAARACFSPAHFYLALAELTNGTSTSAAYNMADPRMTKLLMRLLQQWIQLHAFLAREGAEQQGLARVVASSADLDSADASMIAETPELVTLLEEQERGWNLVLSQTQSLKLYGVPVDFLLAPDYRGSVATQPHHEQTVALPVTMLEGAATHMDLVREYLDEVAASAYGHCYDGGPSAERDEALTRAGRALRYTMTVEALATSLVDGAKVACGTTPGCPSWDGRWQQALGQLRVARERVLGEAAELRQCRNPLGIEESEIPIYFGDPTGSTGRFFAASDYLLSGWAIPAVEGARASFEQARQAWLQRRDSEIQQTLADDDAERRREALAGQYGRELIDLCGLSDVESKDALARFGSGTGQLTAENCFIDQTNPICAVDAEKVYAWVSLDEVKFELCYWKELGAGAGLTSLEANMANGYATATLALDPETGDQEVTSGGESMMLPVFYFSASWFRALATRPDGERAIATCADAFLGVQHNLPAPSDGDPHVAERAECYRGALGETLLAVAAAAMDVEIARSAWNDAQVRYEAQVTYCLGKRADFVDYEAFVAAHTAQMDFMARAKARAEETSSFISNAVSWAVKGVLVAGTCMAGVGIGCLGGAALLGADALGTDYSGDARAIGYDMEEAQRHFEAALLVRNKNEALEDCFHEADMIKIGIDTAALQVQRALIDADIAFGRLQNLKTRVNQIVLEGNAVTAREEGRAVPSIVFHYWLDERVDRFENDFDWARRLTYLAMRAVEYEFQQSLPLRDDILTAQHPDQLEAAIRVLQQEQFTRTINSRRPEEASLVLSVRDQILGLSPLTPERQGERNWSPAVRFQHRLWSPEYAVYDDYGQYLGQGIPMTLTELGPLQHRCAERVWRVTATIQGDLIDVNAPAAPVFLIKRNQFQSQWCDGRGDGEVYQVGAMKPASSLFPDERGGTEAAAIPYTTAMLYPWFNVPRSQFYRDEYTQGSSEELAGRGLYGDYILLFPWGGLLDQGFPLDAVEDVLIRFDYLSVDDITGL